MWAAILFSYCLIFYVASYFIDKRKIEIIWGLSSGLFVVVFTYLVFFTLHLNDFILIIIPAGFVFYLYVTHLMGRVLYECFSKGTRKTKIFFFIPIVIGISVMFVTGLKYSTSAKIIEQSKTENYENLPKDFMTEHIVGMHFKYYSEICLYDGWRPPIHEPLLVMGLWMNGMEDPLSQLSLKERLHLYKQVFPEKPYKMKCGCEYGDNQKYNTDELWQ